MQECFDNNNFLDKTNMSKSEEIINNIVNAIKDNLITPDQAIPYARRLFTAVYTEISNDFIDDVEPIVDGNEVRFFDKLSHDKHVDLYVYPDFYFNDDMIILSYNTIINGEVVKSNNVPASEGPEVLLSFIEEVKNELDYILNLQPPEEDESDIELKLQFLSLNNFLPENMRTDDPYKLIQVVKVLLDGSNNIRKVTEK